MEAVNNKTIINASNFYHHLTSSVKSESYLSVCLGCLSHQTTIAGYDWVAAASASSSPAGCEAECEENGGVCFPRVSLTTTTTSSPACVCPPGYTGPTCSLLATRCQEAPCLHGGVCSDSPDGGYLCDCENTGYSGAQCHLEDNSCAGQTCSNGATCLGEFQYWLA